MRISDVKYSATTGGIYGSSGPFDWVLKSEKKISFRNSSNNISNSDLHSRIYKLSMTILQFNNKRLFDWNIAPNYKICAGFFYVILIDFNVNNLTKNNSFVVVTNKNHSIILKTSSISQKVQDNSQITKQLVDDCLNKLKEIKLSKKNKKYINLTKNFLTDPNFLVVAYLQIKSKPGNMTPSIDQETLDGIDKNWFINAANKIKNNQYIFKPARLIKVPKSNSSEFRPLTIGSPRDKIVQKAISIILNQIYEWEEQVFLNVSHGFRPNRSPHTAANQIKIEWTGLYWFIESDIEKAFDQIHRNVLINLLKKKVKDQRLLDLIRKMFNCKILAPENFYFKNDKGVPQGNVLSPLLCNIYLHELDLFMEELIKKYKKGSNPTPNDIYYKKLELTKYERTLSNEMQENRTRSKRRQLFNQGIKPYLHDGNFIRVRYIRYADDILIGVRGPKLIAEKLKNEVTNWLKSNLHLNLKEKKTKLTFAIGNKINFLGFQLYKRAYNQLPYRNSRRIEKAKRIKARLLALQDNVKTQLSKRLRFDLTKIIQQKIKLNNKAITKKVTNELGDVLVNILGDKVNASSPYREILRQLEYELTEVILNDTNEKIKTVLAHLVNPDFLDPVKFVENNRNYRMQRDITLVSKTKLSEAEFARRFTRLLKENGYEHYKNKDEKKIRFDESVRKYLRANNIKLTYYPTEISLDAKVTEQLVPVSKTCPKKGALANNYKTLIDYFFHLQNTVSPELGVTKAQSQNSKARLKVLETKKGSLIDLPINLRVNWKMIIERLKSRGFLNKKGRPSSVARLMTLTVPEIVKYFRSALYGYLTYYQCVDDFNSAKSRFYWYFKYSLVSTIKAKLKLGGRGKVFKRYGSDITCQNSNGKEVHFIKWEELKKLKRTFLINLPENSPDKFLNTTWINTQNRDFIFDNCAVKECVNRDDVQIHHIRHLQRNGSQNVTILQGRKKKLKSWEAIYAAQKVKQLPLCGKHHNLLHQGKLDIDLIDKSYLIL